MTNARASSTTGIRAVSADRIAVPAIRAYRIGKPLAAVHFEQSGKGRMVFLPEGADLRVIGQSQLNGCLEVMHDDRIYSVFQVDLSGPHSSPILPVQIARADRGLR
jgi:hypothetical protein